ncbi:type II secretion system protein GspG [Kingella potus]|nr:type II secretion system protein GspG [Kingella potus]UOP00401.1 type II secretion system protein GspG [Kingella potus]
MIGTGLHYVRTARSDMAAIARAVEQYRAANGRLPDTLAAAGLHFADSFAVRYNYWENSGEHLLLYKDPLQPFGFYSYDFDNRRWLNDNGEPVTE